MSLHLCNSKKSCIFAALLESQSNHHIRHFSPKTGEALRLLNPIFGLFYCKKMEELNENLSLLFNESIWLNDVSQAEKSFDELMELVEHQNKKPKHYDYYNEFGKCAKIEIVEVEKLANAIWVNLISGEWKTLETPKELWVEAYNSTSN